MICVLTELVLDSRQLIRETHIFAILKDKGIKELCRTGKSLFKYCRGSLSILSVYLEKFNLEGVVLQGQLYQVRALFFSLYFYIIPLIESL
jgi:hypothetical protein